MDKINQIKIEEKLEAIKNLLTIQAKHFMNIDEAAEYTKLSKSTLYKLTSNFLIKHSKPTGKLIYFSKVDLDDFLSNNTVVPIKDKIGESLNP